VQALGTMERLALCSKLFYDIDVIEKHKRILELEKQLQPPEILFSSLKEWTDKYDLIYKNIKKVLYECIVDDEREYYFMFSFGITPKQVVILEYVINKQLYELTGDIKWSEDITDQILLGLHSMFCGFINSNSWRLIYDTLGTQLYDIVYNNIVHQLNHILEDVPQFKCIKCKKICKDEVCSECD